MGLRDLRHERRDERGFTLIELMVVVLVIGILLAVAIPTFLGARSRSQDAVAKGSLRNSLTAANVVFTDAQDYSLADFRGQPVVLVFYPGDDTPVCTKQLNSYNDDLEQFDEMNAQVLGISAQDISSHEAFASKHGFHFPLLADTDTARTDLWLRLNPVSINTGTSTIVRGSRGTTLVTFNAADHLSPDLITYR